MKSAAQGYQVAVVGASSLLGKELLAVLEERTFPVSRLVRFEADDEEPSLPIVDLREHSQIMVADEDVDEAELDFVFLAARAFPDGGESPFLRRALDGQGLRQPHNTQVSPSGTRLGPGGPPASRGLRPSLQGDATENRCVVIDLGEGLAEVRGGVLSIPFLDQNAIGGRDVASHIEKRGEAHPRIIIAPHSGTIVISTLLLRIAARFVLKSAVAQVFSPASDIGTRAIEELQKQTINLLSFQKIPRGVFGAQMAFNLLPRLGRTNRDGLNKLENHIRNQLRHYLGGRAPLPALRFFQVPVFYSLAVSLYVEMDQPIAPEKLGQALTGGRIRVRRFSEPAPSQVEATGTGDILVDAIAPDAGHAAGIWIWAAVDNLRLAAENAVEIAEGLTH